MTHQDAVSRESAIQLEFNPLWLKNTTEENNRYTIGKNGATVTAQMLQQSTLKSKTLISGCNLLQMKSDAICCMKVAMSKAKRILDKNSCLPSGTTLEDYLDKVLEQTNTHIDRAGNTSINAKKGEKSDDEEDAGEGDDDIKTVHVASATTNTGKKHKLFCGWIAFCLYGPHAPAKMQLDILRQKESENPEGRNMADSMS